MGINSIRRVINTVYLAAKLIKSVYDGFRGGSR